jgi:oligopeptide/dipeptide ABC transporter ATP-binding protein
VDVSTELGWTDISWIPQASMNSLDPIERIDDQAVEIAQEHTDMSRSEITDRLKEMFDIVGVPSSRVSDYPHQFSGGMRQRALIAMALYLDPDIVIADEPTTALDVIMQDQVLKYLERIQEELDTSMMLITHDISVVFESCDKMAIMHSGQIAETGTVRDLYHSPRHPYSILLQGAFPDHRYPNRTLEVIEGDPPEQFGEVTSCTFASRCPWAEEECRNIKPELEPIGDGSEEGVQRVSCHRKHEVHELHEREQRERDASTEVGY